MQVFVFFGGSPAHTVLIINCHADIAFDIPDTTVDELPFVVQINFRVTDDGQLAQSLQLLEFAVVYVEDVRSSGTGQSHVTCINGCF